MYIPYGDNNTHLFLRREDERVCPLDNEPIPQEGGVSSDSLIQVM